MRRDCQIVPKCSKCNGKHHTFLHNENYSYKDPKTSAHSSSGNAGGTMRKRVQGEGTPNQNSRSLANNFTSRSNDGGSPITTHTEGVTSDQVADGGGAAGGPDLGISLQSGTKPSISYWKTLRTFK